MGTKATCPHVSFATWQRKMTICSDSRELIKISITLPRSVRSSLKVFMQSHTRRGRRSGLRVTPWVLLAVAPSWVPTTQFGGIKHADDSSTRDPRRAGKLCFKLFSNPEHLRVLHLWSQRVPLGLLGCCWWPSSLQVGAAPQHAAVICDVASAWLIAGQPVWLVFLAHTRLRGAASSRRVPSRAGTTFQWVKETPPLFVPCSSQIAGRALPHVGGPKVHSRSLQLEAPQRRAQELPTPFRGAWEGVDAFQGQVRISSDTHQNST